MNVGEMTRKDFAALPLRDGFDKDIGPFDSLVILPGTRRDMHDSGYRCMDFVACRGAEPICRLSGCSDVVHIDGIGGFGYQWLKRYGRCPTEVPVTSWNIDCLPKSGLLRLFSDSGMRAGSALSSFEVFAEPRKRNLDNGA